MKRFGSLIVGLAACAALLIGAPAAFAQAPSATELAPEAPQRVLPDYHMGAGDKIRVIVYGEEALSNEYFVSSAGNVSMPLIGEVAAVGRTVGEFQEAVAARLRDGYLKEPRVSVEVLNYRPFYILGEVNRPGEYPYTSALTVMNAVATAQGFTYRADQKKVYVRRADETKEEVYPLTSTTPVAPGDTIRIGERFF
ncbi:MAG: polysaccharide biosynthesis/export family protein [Phenylobacterium sp.]|uniref:polysaccharide biosynthesis/export family protein n=1 Tax=Phenylobacterium sp. TaxID=1871053 RepID=UPI00391970CE